MYILNKNTNIVLSGVLDYSSCDNTTSFESDKRKDFDLFKILISKFNNTKYSVFIKESDDVPVLQSSRRKFSNLFSIVANIIIFLICITVGSTNSGVVSTLSDLGIFNKYILLFFVGIIVFFHFQSKSSLFFSLKLI